MAPEMLIMLGRHKLHKDGYTFAVDYWSLGILIYKLLVGVEPYKGYSFERLQDIMHSYICQHKSFVEAFYALFGVIDYDDCRINDDTKSLLELLLELNADKRINYTNHPVLGQTALMNHPFFQGLDWALLELKQIIPPYIPSESDIIDFIRISSKPFKSNITTVEGEPEDNNSGIIVDEPVTLMDILGIAKKPQWNYEFQSMLSKRNNINTLSNANNNANNNNNCNNNDSYDMNNWENIGFRMQAASKLVVSEEDQHYFRMWNYVNPKLLAIALSDTVLK